MKIFKAILTITILSLFVTSCSKDETTTPEPTPTELNFSNGNLSTGAISSNGTAAPTGYTWSEIEATNPLNGFNATDNYFLADDFIIPAGEKWTINKFIFYAYQTDYFGTNSPFNEVKYEIYTSNPSAAGVSKIFGDFATNKYVTSEDSKIYRIKNASSVINRKIYKITASATDLVLTTGTYWIKWQTKTNTSSLNFNPPNTTSGIAGVASYNAINQSAGVWAALENGTGNKVDFPFGIVGTKTKI